MAGERAVGASPARPPHRGATLARLDADVIALQEVWSNETTNLATELATELGYRHGFASGMDMKRFGFGEAPPASMVASILARQSTISLSASS